MTIGIAAYGPDAGRAIFRALAAVEGVARGAIGGFVSAAALTAEGDLIRAETQRGGSEAVFGEGIGNMPDAFAAARAAVLMSSGPDRPAPLSQFTPGQVGVGLITGHRMPNTVGASGLNLNDEVLALMRAGLSPLDATERVVTANPDVDAGLIALAADGRLHLADTAHVRRRGDAGNALVSAAGGTARVGVLHNAMLPFRPLAALAAEVALDTMQPADRPTGWVTLNRGTPLVRGIENALHVDRQGIASRIVVDNPKFLAGEWNIGIGFETPILGDAGTAAVLLYEPYMIARDGRLESVDGKDGLVLPVRAVLA